MNSEYFKIIIIILLITLGFIYGVPLLFKIFSSKMNKKGRAKLEEFRNNPVDVRTILGEMRYIAEVTLEAFNKYWEIENNVGTKTIALLSGERSYLNSVMDDNVRGEWTPRLIFLKERQDLFDDNRDLYNAFLDCEKIDKNMQKFTEAERNMTIANKSLRNLVKTGLVIGAGSAIAGIALVAVTTCMINKGGKDIGS